MVKANHGNCRRWKVNAEHTSDAPKNIEETMITTETKERPILFSGPMVGAIREGRKTQTRRIVKDLIFDPDHDLPCMIAEDGPLAFPERFYDGTIKCPHGQPGDCLWVREAWAPLVVGNERDFIYRADTHAGLEKRDGDQKWKPSIHMPRIACRLMLEITGIRVERLNEISRGDAMGEGCPFQNIQDANDPRAWFKALWSQINGPESWTANPWVWVVEFKVL
jgi:hypothetical protein